MMGTNESVIEAAFHDEIIFNGFRQAGWLMVLCPRLGSVGLRTAARRAQCQKFEKSKKISGKGAQKKGNGKGNGKKVSGDAGVIPKAMQGNVESVSKKDENEGKLHKKVNIRVVKIWMHPGESR